MLSNGYYRPALAKSHVPAANNNRIARTAELQQAKAST
jgi:hypothetical protein